MGKINVHKEIVIETKKKREYMEIKRIFLENLHIKHGLGMEFTVC